MKLAGKRVIVTGSSSGIGRTIALRLAAEGARVVINARGARPEGTRAIDAVVEEIRHAGGEASAFAGAVNDPEVAQALVDHCIDAFGGIDILVNNAGQYAATPVDQCTLEEWRTLLETNLSGVFLLCRAALPHMRDQRWGRIINASSSAGQGNMGTSAYAASKSALYGLTRAIAADYGPYGITANCYNPEALGVMGGTQDRSNFEGMLKHYLDRGYCTATQIHSMSGIGAPDGVAPWIAYLCTDEADNLNGQTFAVEARRVALIHEPDESRVLFKDVEDGLFTMDQLSRIAPLAFPLVNRWPRREGQALADWEKA